MAEFVMFYAPFIVVFGSIAAAFWLAGKDERVEE
ncbi:cytochrome bd oxidase small subunit CydS [Cytobacillus firmus]